MCTGGNSNSSICSKGVNNQLRLDSSSNNKGDVSNQLRLHSSSNKGDVNN